MTKITPLTAAIQRTVLAIKDRLNETAIDGIVSHEEIRNMIPGDILEQLTHYVLVQRAQRLLNAENGAVFATVRREGYRRLSHGVGADYASNLALLRIRSQSRRGQKIATLAIEFANDISDNDRRRVYQKIASLGMIEHLSMNKTIETMPAVKPRPDPLAGLREMLGAAAK
jgi:hypothetical protein